MKKTQIIIVMFFMLFFNINVTYAQSKTTIKNSFVIHGDHLKSSDIDFFTKSIEAADFEQFRLQTQTVILVFKNGFTLELISAKDLVINNIKQDLDVNSYTNYPAMPNYQYPVFEVLPSGWITAGVESSSKK